MKDDVLFDGRPFKGHCLLRETDSNRRPPGKPSELPTAPSRDKETLKRLLFNWQDVLSLANLLSGTQNCQK